MAIIHAPTSPVARCRICGVHRQFHAKSDVPHSADRDHAFEAEMIEDFEPSDLAPAQLIDQIFEYPNTPRAVACGTELRARVVADWGIGWEDLKEALA